MELTTIMSRGINGCLLLSFKPVCRTPVRYIDEGYFVENCCVLFQISLKFLANNHLDDMPALAQIIAGENPLSETMVPYFTDSCMRQLVSRR